MLSSISIDWEETAQTGQSHHQVMGENLNSLNFDSLIKTVCQIIHWRKTPKNSILTIDL